MFANARRGSYARDMTICFLDNPACGRNSIPIEGIVLL
jgi:hypothetical protein